MPKLNALSPSVWGALELVPFALNFAFVPYRESFFRAGPAHRLLAAANNRNLPVFPTLPALFNGTNYLTAANYARGVRGTDLQAGSTTRGRVWVSAKKPWLRDESQLWSPRMVVVSGAAVWGGNLDPVEAALDTAWDAFNEGGWEVAALGQSDDPFWGLPVLDTDYGATGLEGDFAGYFGELVQCSVGRADVTCFPFEYI
ncbi:MAG TPA: hypothetical protein VFG68_22930, partial [Fimbriiglobus sp.]|nr:hypothetical protein [Fimbriiglobus sp.]